MNAAVRALFDDAAITGAQAAGLQGLNAIVIDPVKCPCVLQEFLEWEYEVAPDGTVLGTLMEANDHGIDAARYACSRIWQRKGA